MPTANPIRDHLRSFALSLPEAYEDFPWGERVVKVRKKIFLFLGTDDDPGLHCAGVKLRDSHELALAAPGAAPSGYGLGKAGWVTLRYREDLPPVEVLTDWVEESYRL